MIGDGNVKVPFAVRLLVPNDLAAIVAEIIGESLATFGYRTAHSTDPSLRSAKVGPRLILHAFRAFGTHGGAKYSPAWLHFAEFGEFWF